MICMSSYFTLTRRLPLALTRRNNKKNSFPWILWIDLCGRAWGRHRFRENHGARAAIGSTREERGGAEEAGGGRNLAVLVRPGAVQVTPHATTEVRGVLRGVSDAACDVA